MAIERWTPRREVTRQEQFLLKRLGRVKKLFGFLRRVRHDLFSEEFQAELAGMYRDTGAGKQAVPPALMAMATLVQGYLGVSDAEMVELTVVDLRVQMVLDRLGAQEPAFSQGALQDFRTRLIAADLDRRLLERTVELARSTGEIDPKSIGRVRIAMDSAPLEGAGRVEDTFNLLAHAARKIVACTAGLLDWSAERVHAAAGVSLLQESSIKKALDIDWNDPEEKANAIRRLDTELDSLLAWIKRELPEASQQPPLKELTETLEQLRSQDLEPDPGGGGKRIKQGVAPDRRVSVEDAQMRHGRKSKTKRFNGYKRHIAVDIDNRLTLACAVLPANQAEEAAAEMLCAEIQRQGFSIAGLYIDRGYINSTVVDDILARRGEIICRPWRSRNGALFPKAAFKLNVRDRTITCPAGQTQTFDFGTQIEFEPAICDACALRERCTSAEPGQGRTVSIAENEQLQQRLRKLIATPRGRAKLRERTTVEHQLSHLVRRQGRRARYLGIRKNTFDARRAAAIGNLESAHRLEMGLELRKVA